MSQVGETSNQRRRRAKERLRIGFLAQALREVDELLLLAQDEEEAPLADVAHHTLSRMATTADSLDLAEVSAAATEAASTVLQGLGEEALRPLARALQGAGAGSRFPAIAIVAAGRLAEQLAVQAELCCEPLEVYDSVADLRDNVGTNRVQGVVVPAADLGELGELDEAASVVLAYGDAADLAGRRRAVDAGAAGYVPLPLRLADVVDYVRFDVHATMSPVRVVVFAPPGDARDAILADLTANDVLAQATGDLAELFELLVRAGPELVLLGPSPHREEIAGLIYNGRDFRHVAVVLVPGDPDDTRAIVGRVLGRLVERRTRGGDLDRVSGALTRPAVLRALDDELARARRRGDALSAVLLELHGLGDVNARWGRTAGDQVLRAFASRLRSHLRTEDLVGRVGPSVFLAVLSACRAPDAARRTDAFRGAWAERGQRLERLAAVGFSAGVADTRHGLNKLLLHADGLLVRARALGGDRTLVE